MLAALDRELSSSTNEEACLEPQTQSPTQAETEIGTPYSGVKRYLPHDRIAQEPWYPTNFHLGPLDPSAPSSHASQKGLGTSGRPEAPSCYASCAGARQHPCQEWPVRPLLARSVARIGAICLARRNRADTWASRLSRVKCINTARDGGGGQGGCQQRPTCVGCV